MSQPAAAPEPDGRGEEHDFFLPDFCEARAIVPALMLQPLLENAIGHGIEPLPQGDHARPS